MAAVSRHGGRPVTDFGLLGVVVLVIPCLTYLDNGGAIAITFLIDYMLRAEVVLY